MARRPTEPTANPARGAALVVVAVLIGLFLLRNGLDTSETVVPSSDGSVTDGADEGTDESTDTATDESTDSTNDTVALRPATQVSAVVLNGSGVTGAAGRYSEVLGGLGYQLTDENGADATADVATTQVLHGPGFEGEAAALATAIGAPATAVQPLGTTQPGVINGAQVVVVLGPDLANTTPSTPTSVG
jgi:hypothetical protein